MVKPGPGSEPCLKSSWCSEYVTWGKKNPINFNKNKAIVGCYWQKVGCAFPDWKRPGKLPPASFIKENQNPARAVLAVVGSKFTINEETFPHGETRGRAQRSRTLQPRDTALPNAAPAAPAKSQRSWPGRDIAIWPRCCDHAAHGDQASPGGCVTSGNCLSTAAHRVRRIPPRP